MIVPFKPFEVEADVAVNFFFLFGLENFDCIPDIIEYGKGLGGGIPIGAFTSSKKLMDVLHVNPILGHITTFGANPVITAAALQTLEIVLNSKIMQNREQWTDGANAFALSPGKIIGYDWNKFTLEELKKNLDIATELLRQVTLANVNLQKRDENIVESLNSDSLVYYIDDLKNDVNDLRNFSLQLLANTALADSRSEFNAFKNDTKK